MLDYQEYCHRVRACWCGAGWSAAPHEHGQACFVSAMLSRGSNHRTVLKLIAAGVEPCDWGWTQGAIFDALASAPRDRAQALAGKLYILRQRRGAKGVYVDAPEWLATMASHVWSDWPETYRLAPGPTSAELCAFLAGTEEQLSAWPR